jgi:hypothetical protein
MFPVVLCPARLSLSLGHIKGEEMIAQDKIVKVLAFLLVVGGLLGIGISVYMGYTFVQQHWIYLVLVVGFAALFVWTVLTGIRLWQNDPRGWRWGKILFAAQIPVLTVPGFSYEYYSGIAIKILGGQVDDHFKMALGANANLYLDTRITDLFYGINLFALFALIYLLAKSRPNTALNTDAQKTRAG